MNWDLFLKNLGALNQDLSATSEKKEEVYNILVNHNKKAEIDFLIRLSTRKINKLIKNTENVANYQKNDFSKSDYESFTESFNMQFQKASEINDTTRYIENLKYNKSKSDIINGVETPNVVVSTSFLYNYIYN